MTYRVRITPTALADAEELYLWIAQDSPARAVKWFNGLFDVIETLASLPRRCPMAPEAEIVGQEIRCLLYTKRYRILFRVEDDTVMIYHIRHTAQQWMTREEFLRSPSTDTEQDE